MNKIDEAIIGFEAFQRLYETALQQWKFAQTNQQVREIIPLYEIAVPQTKDWVQAYELYIQRLKPSVGFPFTTEMFEWMKMLEQIKIYWLPQFKILIASQKMKHPLTTVTDQVEKKVNQLLGTYIYPFD